jgi:signal recognition particle subunit SRP54
MTGQEAATLTSRFNSDIGITGAILTKMDGDTRGGSALSIRGVSGKPIKFVGVGEGMDDLEPFYPERMASRILGMGDVATLLEKAQDAFDKDKAAKLGRKMQKGDFDFDDFLLQAQSLKKMGKFGDIIYRGGNYRGYYSILVVSCLMRNGAADSSHVLLPYSITSLASLMTCQYTN